jgi:hypothetical protein
LNLRKNQGILAKNQIREKLEALSASPTIKGNLGYVEGPPTLNGIPHIVTYEAES